MKYNHKEIEKKWQDKWGREGIYKDYKKKKKFYALDMFPYPSGAGLHVGHPKGYIATDVYARFMMLNGYSVLHPMGWDAFGLPAENYAIENKIHPKIAVEKNIATFKNQLLKFGFTYDWDREINTTDPDYYKWTQWIFLKMFENGLAYESDEPINWCPKCKTGLALEDLEGGYCERCGTQVAQKKMRQWVLKMTDYADRLLYDLDNKELDWEDQIKEQQRNWIGRSEGSIIKFNVIARRSEATTRQSRQRAIAEIASSRRGGGTRNDSYIEVFTTRVDTIYGCTYVVVAPEHEIIGKLKDKIENYDEVEKYLIEAQNKTELERMEMKEKSGVEIKGIKVINPFNGEEIPLFVADYVLGHYGTGAVMAVPAHDERDFAFAKKYNLPIKKVIKAPLKGVGGFESSNNPPIPPYRGGDLDKAFTDDGELINSGEFTGMTSEKAREEMTKWLEKEKIGKKKINYKMRNWVFSRQRYWGEPFPLVFCKHCAEKIKNHPAKGGTKIKNNEFSRGELLNPGWIAVLEKDLPIELPDVKSYEPTGTGEGPLINIKEWVNTKCPKCGGTAKRETNTMPQWAGSSWYYLRYIDNKNNKSLIDKKKEKEWMPVDLYVGGAEHATRHLLYARFWHKFLYDIEAVSTKEPFKRLIHVGLINGEDGRKMSKRWGNVINPDDIIEIYGADSIRLYEMFMGPFIQNIAWSTKGVVGVRRFLEKVWRLNPKSEIRNPKQIQNSNNQNSKINLLLNKTIKKITEDIENFRFNTAISQMMILVNAMEKEKEIPIINPVKYSEADAKQFNGVNYSLFLILLSPFAPHICEELWEKLGHHRQGGTGKDSIFKQKWPEYDEKLIKDEMIKLVIQVNGKVRDMVEADADISETEAKKIALESEKIKKWTEGKEIKKVIFVKGRLVNVVTSKT